VAGRAAQARKKGERAEQQYRARVDAMVRRIRASAIRNGGGNTHGHVFVASCLGERREDGSCRSLPLSNVAKSWRARAQLSGTARIAKREAIASRRSEPELVYKPRVTNDEERPR